MTNEAKPTWEAEWDTLVKAAQGEGKLVLVTTVGAGFRDAVAAFEAAFPGILVEHTSLQASQFTPRLLQERQAGIYSYDAMTTTWVIVPRAMATNGALEPVRSVLFRPDVLDDKAWRDRFAGGYLDLGEPKWVYAYAQERSESLWVNSDLVQEGEIKSVQDLLNPKWKGKITGSDPRAQGGGFNPATVMRLAYGDDIIKRLWKDQEVVLSRDERQLTESMVRGRYAIGIGAVYKVVLAEFMAQGLAKNLKRLDLDNVDNVGASGNVLLVFNRAPHPTAAKLFANWLLTREGQATWTKHALSNSRRVDVEPTNPRVQPDPARKYPQLDAGGMLDEVAKTQDLAKAALN